MPNYVIHPGTETIIDLAECAVVEHTGEYDEAAILDTAIAMLSNNSQRFIAVDINTFTETQALNLWSELRQKFQWAGTFFTMSDVPVTVLDSEGNEEEVYDHEFTQAQREAIADTRDWSKGIAEHMAEVGNEYLMPKLHIYTLDGSFSVEEASGEEHFFTVDGSVIV